MDARTLAWIDRRGARMTEITRKNGRMIDYIGGGRCDYPDCPGVDDDGPPFAYTVGLFGLGHRELLIFGSRPRPPPRYSTRLESVSAQGRA